METLDNDYDDPGSVSIGCVVGLIGSGEPENYFDEAAMVSGSVLSACGHRRVLGKRLERDLSRFRGCLLVDVGRVVSKGALY